MIGLCKFLRQDLTLAQVQSPFHALCSKCFSLFSLCTALILCFSHFLTLLFQKYSEIILWSHISQDPTPAQLQGPFQVLCSKFWPLAVQFQLNPVLYTPPRVLVESARTARTHSDSVRTPHRLCGLLMILGVHTKITLWGNWTRLPEPIATSREACFTTVLLWPVIPCQLVLYM